MPDELPIAALRKILQLERRNFKLEQQLAAAKSNYAKRLEAMKAKHEAQLAELKAENAQLQMQPFIMTKERLAELQARKRACIEERRKPNEAK